jgi:hypothetical protein
MKLQMNLYCCSRTPDVDSIFSKWQRQLRKAKDSENGTLDTLILALGLDDAVIYLSARHAGSFSSSLNELSPLHSTPDAMADILNVTWLRRIPLSSDILSLMTQHLYSPHQI